MDTNTVRVQVYTGVRTQGTTKPERLRVKETEIRQAIPRRPAGRQIQPQPRARQPLSRVKNSVAARRESKTRKNSQCKVQIHSEYLCLAAPVLLPDHMNSLVLVLAAHPVRHHNESAPARLKPKCIAKASGNSKSKPRRCIATGIISGKPEDVVGPRVARHSLFGEQFEHSVRLEAICGIDLFFFQRSP